MYGYEKYLEITAQHILTKITQEDIFKFVFEKPIILNSKYISPFRDDKNPGCFFTQREDSTIIFVDFAESVGYTHRSCFQAVMDKYNVDYQKAITIVLDNFHLSYNIEDYDLIKITNSSYNYNSRYKGDKVKSGTSIEYVKSEFDRRDVMNWNKFIISTKDLLEDKVYATHRFTIDKHDGYPKRVFNIHNICYAIDFIDAVKIYQPTSTDYRFITNCNENHIGNINNLPLFGDKLVIQKSYKDHRVLRNLVSELNVIWFQNEGVIPDDFILINLLERFKEIIIFYDNDFKGIEKALILCNYLNNIRPDSTKIVHLPNNINSKNNWKDPAQFVYKEGRKDTLEVLKQIKVI